MPGSCLFPSFSSLCAPASPGPASEGPHLPRPLELQTDLWLGDCGRGPRTAESQVLGPGGTRSTEGVGLRIRLPWLVGNHVLPCAGKVLGNLQLNLLSKSKVYEDPALERPSSCTTTTTTSSRPWRSKWPRGCSGAHLPLPGLLGMAMPLVSR